MSDRERIRKRPGNPARDALVQLAEELDQIANATKQDSPTYTGYALGMKHAAERAWNAADDADA